MDQSRFRAMGTDVDLLVIGGPTGLAEQGRSSIERLEQRWSRFRPDSEISELNRRAGQVVTVSPETADLVARAVDAWRFTGGGFDPTVLGAMIDAGYDRSFELVGSGSLGVADGLVVGCTDIEVDGCDVRLPAATGFDPGGIGKGLAADLVAAELAAAGAEGVCVLAGSAWVAEVLAKAVLLRGAARAFDIVDGTGVEALVVDRDGALAATHGLARFLGGTSLPATLTAARTMVATLPRAAS